jgi:dienelactone hydrolase
MKGTNFISLLVGLVVSMTAAAAMAADPDKLPAKVGMPDLYISVVHPRSSGPVPTAVLLHGGTGLSDGNQAESVKQWSAWLAERGMASLVIDSQRGRHTSGQPSPRTAADYLALLRERTGDAQRGLEWLASTGWADPQRLLLFGQSQGGATAIIGAADGVLRVPQVDLYPVCKIMPAKTSGLQGFPRSLWVLGEGDEVAPAKDCLQLRASYTSAGAPSIDLVTIPGAYHAFDFPMSRPGTYLGKHVEFSANARDQARVEVEKFLRMLGYIR